MYLRYALKIWAKKCTKGFSGFFNYHVTQIMILRTTVKIYTPNFPLDQLCFNVSKNKQTGKALGHPLATSGKLSFQVNTLNTSLCVWGLSGSTQLPKDLLLACLNFTFIPYVFLFWQENPQGNHYLTVHLHKTPIRLTQVKN